MLLCIWHTVSPATEHTTDFFIQHFVYSIKEDVIPQALVRFISSLDKLWTLFRASHFVKHFISHFSVFFVVFFYFSKFLRKFLLLNQWLWKKSLLCDFVGSYDMVETVTTTIWINANNPYAFANCDTCCITTMVCDSPLLSYLPLDISYTTTLTRAQRGYIMYANTCAFAAVW